MLKIIKNTFKVLFRKPSSILLLIIIPSLITVAFSYMLGSETNSSVGLINKDNGIVSNTIIEKLENTDTFTLKKINENELDSAIVGKEIELAIIFEKDFSSNIINGDIDTVKIKSIGDSQVKATISSLISSETSILKSIGSIAKGNQDKFKSLLKDFNSSKIDYSLNDINEKKISVYTSVGMQIMILMTSSFFVTRFVIDDEKFGTKDRILLGNISKTSYYFGILITFYICLSLSSIFYFLICNILKFDFVTDTTINFLIVLLSINFFAIGFNLFIITLSKTPQVAANISTIFIVVGCMLSGLFWPFSFMPKSIQKIGNLIPLRWASIAFEKIQEGLPLEDIVIYLLGIICAGLVCLLLTVVISGKKKSVRI